MGLQQPAKCQQKRHPCPLAGLILRAVQPPEPPNQQWQKEHGRILAQCGAHIYTNQPVRGQRIQKTADQRQRPPPEYTPETPVTQCRSGGRHNMHVRMNRGSHRQPKQPQQGREVQEQLSVKQRCTVSIAVFCCRIYPHRELTKPQSVSCELDAGKMKRPVVSKVGTALQRQCRSQHKDNKDPCHSSAVPCT